MQKYEYAELMIEEISGPDSSFSFKGVLVEEEVCDDVEYNASIKIFNHFAKQGWRVRFKDEQLFYKNKITKTYLLEREVGENNG